MPVLAKTIQCYTPKSYSLFYTTYYVVLSEVFCFGQKRTSEVSTAVVRYTALFFSVLKVSLLDVCFFFSSVFTSFVVSIHIPGLLR